MASSPVATASPSERGSLKYFQNARLRWQSSPRQRLSPMPERKTPPLPKVPPASFSSLFTAEPFALDDKTETSSGQATESTKSAAETHAKSLFSSKSLFQSDPVAASAGTPATGKEVAMTQKQSQTKESTTTTTVKKDSESEIESTDSYRERLIAFYKEHNPAKLDTVDATLAKFAGKEEELFDKLKKKYLQSSGMPLAHGEGPTCFLEFEYGEKKGRVEVKLFADKTPLAAENFRALCTGELGMGRSTKPLCYRNCSMHRIVDNFVIQGGDFTKGDGTGGESIYPPNSENGDFWGKFKDEPFMQHNQKGLLSMANNGPDRNSSQFFITLGALPSLNGKHVVFGKVTSGMEIVEEVSKLPTDKIQRPLQRVTIIDCGEIRDGKDIRASEQAATSSSAGVPSTPFGFTACKPMPPFGGSSSKESPFSVAASSKTKTTTFESSTTSNESPFLFTSSSSKPFGGAAATSTTPFSFSALAAQTDSAPAPTASFNFSTSLTTSGATTEAADYSSASSDESDATTSSDEESEDDDGAATPARAFGFGTGASAPTAAPNFSFASNKDTATTAPFSFATSKFSPQPSTSSETISGFSAPAIDSKQSATEATSITLDQEDGHQSRSTESQEEEPDDSSDKDDDRHVSITEPVSDEEDEPKARDLSDSPPSATAVDSVPLAKEKVVASSIDDGQHETEAPKTEETWQVSLMKEPSSDVDDGSSEGNTTESDTSSSPPIDERSPPSKSNVSSTSPRRMVTVSSRTMESQGNAPPEKQAAANPFAGINFAEKVKGDYSEQLKNLALVGSKSTEPSDVASSTEISEIESGASSETTTSPRNAAVSTPAPETKQDEDTQANDSTPDKPTVSFGFTNAVGQTNATAKLPIPDNPFATFSVSKAPAPPASSFSFGSTASNQGASFSTQQTKSDETLKQSTFSFVSATNSSSSATPSTTFAFAQNEEPKSPMSSPSRLTSWFGSPKDKKD